MRGRGLLHAWYDLPPGTERDAEVSEGIDASRAALERVLDGVGVPPARTFLLGFSQGGALALYAAVQGRALGGV